MIESFGSRLEAILNQSCYLQGFSKRYNQTKLTSNCFEEICANSYAREKTIAQLHKGEIFLETILDGLSMHGSVINHLGTKKLLELNLHGSQISDQNYMKITQTIHQVFRASELNQTLPIFPQFGRLQDFLIEGLGILIQEFFT